LKSRTPRVYPLGVRDFNLKPIHHLKSQCRRRSVPREPTSCTCLRLPASWTLKCGAQVRASSARQVQAFTVTSELTLLHRPQRGWSCGSCHVAEAARDAVHTCITTQICKNVAESSLPYRSFYSLTAPSSWWLGSSSPPLHWIDSSSESVCFSHDTVSIY